MGQFPACFHTSSQKLRAGAAMIFQGSWGAMRESDTESQAAEVLQPKKTTKIVEMHGEYTMQESI